MVHGVPAVHVQTTHSGHTARGLPFRRPLPDGAERLRPDAAEDAPSAQLKSELLTAPVGSKPYAGGTLAPGGVLNASQFVDGNFIKADRSNETDDITGEDFKCAVETNWSAQDGTQADVFLLQFADSDGAQGYVSDVSESTSEQEEPSEPLTSVPGVPGSEAWAAGTINTNGDISQISWTAHGNIVVEVHYYSPGTADAAGFDLLVRDQYARVTGGVDTPSPLPAPTGRAPAPVATGAATATGADRNRLKGDLVPLPGGAQPWQSTSQDGPTGVLTLSQFISRFADASEAKRATAEEVDRGFQYAVRENWIASDGSQADVLLLQFATATGAQSFVLATRAGSGTRSAPGAPTPSPAAATPWPSSTAGSTVTGTFTPTVTPWSATSPSTSTSGPRPRPTGRP